MKEQPQLNVKDVWETGGAYESFVGRWSRLVAVEFLQWLSVAPKCKWLDIGCGTGMLTKTILELADPLEVTGIDPSPGFISFARSHISDLRAGFEVGTADSIKSEANTYDAVVSGLVLNFVPEQDRALSEMKRISKRGGCIAAYIWDYADQMKILRHFWDAALSLDPPSRDLDEGRRFPVCRPEPLRELFLSCGLHDVVVRAIDVQAHFTGFDDFWSPFLSGQGPAPSYVATLSKEQRSVLEERLRATLPINADGTISLNSRAWAVRATS